MRKHIHNLTIFVALLLVLGGVPSLLFAQKRGLPLNSVTVFNEKLASKLMQREMPYRVVVPTNYTSDAKKRFPALYLLHGLGGNYKNWTEQTKLSEYVKQYEIIVVTPEGENGWYSDSATNEKNKYESYIIQELIPEIDKKFQTISGREGRAIAGLSMGGYGALKFGLKYPDKFIFAGSLSGAHKAATWTEQELTVAGNWVKEPIMKAFGDYQTGTRKQNDVYQIIKDLTPEQTAKLPFIYVDCGTEDFLFNDNVLLMQTLQSKKVKHEYRQLPGAHNWQYWDKQVQEVLRLGNGFLSKAQ